MAYERDFSHIPVLNRSRRPMGFVDVAQLKEKWESGTGNPHDKANDYMQRFVRNPDQPYTAISPLTPLDEVEKFLKVSVAIYGDFALGLCLRHRLFRKENGPPCFGDLSLSVESNLASRPLLPDARQVFVGFGRIARATLRRLSAFGITHCLYTTRASSVPSAQSFGFDYPPQYWT